MVRLERLDVGQLVEGHHRVVDGGVARVAHAVREKHRHEHGEHVAQLPGELKDDHLLAVHARQEGVAVLSHSWPLESRARADVDTVRVTPAASAAAPTTAYPPAVICTSTGVMSLRKRMYSSEWKAFAAKVAAADEIAEHYRLTLQWFRTREA